LGSRRKCSIPFLDALCISARYIGSISAPPLCLHLAALPGAVKPYSLFLCFVDHALEPILTEFTPLLAFFQWFYVSWVLRSNLHLLCCIFNSFQSAGKRLSANNVFILAFSLNCGIYTTGSFEWPAR
jgi:hypothetical protein